MNKLSKVLAIILSVVTVVCVAVIIKLASDNQKLSQENGGMRCYETELENMYQKAYYELIDSVKNLDASLNKLTVANDKVTQQTLLSDIVGQADTAKSDLSSLPLENETLVKSLTFTNKVSDYCKSLQKKIISGGNITATDRSNIEGLAETSAALNDALQTMSENGDCKFTDCLKNNGRLEGISDGFDELNEKSFAYPELIYDGPFSDAKQKDIEIDAPSMTKEDVLAKVEKQLSSFGLKNFEFVNEADNKLEVYGFSATDANGRDVYIQATKNGGYLSMITTSGISENAKTPDSEEAQKKAEEFARALGYDVKPVWVSKSGEGCIYVNLAPVVGDVIIYPDLVKVSLDQNGICGFESFNYLANHKIRKFDKMRRNPEEGKRYLAEGLVVNNVNTVLVPKNDKEILCFEYDCEYNGSQYFVFLNADTFAEEDIFKVIKGTEGYTVM